MPKIEINEIDLTTPGTLAEDFDVVYVPGLVDTSQACLRTNGKYTGIEVNKPTLFTSVHAFETLCGTQPMKFDSAQDYRSLNPGFSADAVPFTNVMFEANAVDPGYVMAKELLGAGLNVLFERINGDVEYIPAGYAPADIQTNYSSYYTKKEPATLTENNMQLITSIDPQILTGKVELTITDNNTTVGAPLPVSSTDQAKAYLNSLHYNGEAGKITKLSVENDDSFNALVEEVSGVFKWKLKTENNKTVAVAYDTYGDLYETYNHFYSKQVSGTTTTFTLLDTTPEDFATNYWKDYYEVKEYTYTKLTSANTSDFLYKKVNEEISIQDVYNALGGVFNASSREGLSDMGRYSIKYLTSGGYPVFEYNNGTIVDAMTNLAATRGDCVALIDHTDNSFRVQNINIAESVYSTLNRSTITDGEFAAMFTPWAGYNRITTDKDKDSKTIKYEAPFRMPASFAYLKSLADSIKTNAPWLAIAGVTRGLVRNLADGGMTTEIPNGAADEMQPRGDGKMSINAITNINPYGYTIWGNRTLKSNAENLTATSLLNIRNLVSDVKKVCYRTARKLTFEQNNDILWVNFKSSIAPTLDRMVSGYGISGYKFVRDYEHEKAQEKATICAKIYLYPVYAVEDFYISIVLKDEEVSVQVSE